ncbi:ABC transporter substrate-binding protein [Ornithinimicrobium cerasi]|uniref:ABC transporter substrate-binding protein n=1 Tax=Ornithinimicrobium cerasi TaxID=2248773 RepID=A0A285VX59_9MICO|nr:ABC transporter substrate-binding protein [Ornithinimicrobium cerasi]SOC57251.1 hypothetical protein SAMN05421879_11179 [Ornithinimicrobium cerasi]
MLRRKLLGTFAVTLLAGTIGMAPAATAAAPAPTAAVSAPVATARPAPTAETVTGTVTNADDVTSQFTGAISDLTARTVDGVLTLTGTLTGTGLAPGGVPFSTTVESLDVSQACTILDLTLGPINLDVLGLVIDLNQVELDITAVPGAGNLLGNLLCAITGLLDGGGPLQGIGALLNRLLTGLGL